MRPLYNEYPRLPLFERLAFSSALVLMFMFFGILMFNRYFNLPNSIVSASIRFYILTIGFALFVKSLFSSEYGKFPPSLWAMLVYMLYITVLLVLYEPPNTYRGYGSEYGKMFDIYVFTAYGLAPALLFLLSPARLDFLVRNAFFLIFVPNMLTVVILIVLFGDILSHESAGILEDMAGINRSMWSEPLMYLFVFSVFYVVFFDKLWKLAGGAAGLLLVLYGIYLSSSQSLLLIALCVSTTAFLISFRSKKSLIMSIALGVGGGMFAVPFLARSRGWSRLEQLFSISEQYSLGGTYDVSRIDLFKEAYSLFMSSPFIGGNLYLSGGDGSHMMIMDILMAQGIVGLFLFIMILYGMLKGAIYVLRHLGLNSYWIILLTVAIFINSVTHGSLRTLMSAPVLILLSCQMAAMNSRRP